MGNSPITKYDITVTYTGTNDIKRFESNSAGGSYISPGGNYFKAGVKYDFTVLAKNIFGVGPSTQASLIAKFVPSTPDRPVVYINDSTTKVKITWKTSTQANGSPITECKLFLGSIDVSRNCGQDNSPLKVRCDLEMSYFWPLQSS
jgi:hypothetical protein